MTAPLPPRLFFRLFELATRATKIHKTGGWQDRLRAWRGQMNETTRTITLFTTSNDTKRLDDVTFVIHAIEQVHKGGWQAYAFDIFAGSHPRFSDITVRPREIRR